MRTMFLIGKQCVSVFEAQMVMGAHAFTLIDHIGEGFETSPPMSQDDGRAVECGRFLCAKGCPVQTCEGDRLIGASRQTLSRCASGFRICAGTFPRRSAALAGSRIRHGPPRSGPGSQVA